MEIERNRFSLSPEEYLNEHHILVYMEDCVAQMLEAKDEKVDSNSFILQYFTNVRDGHHVMFREYSFIQKTPHNRVSFIRLVWKCFGKIGRIKDLLSIHEYHSLITLLCPNFPFDLLYKTARIILLDDALDCLISFSDFIYTFQLQFYYQEFLGKICETYESLQQGETIAQDTVVVPSGSEYKKVHPNTTVPSSAQDGVSVAQLVRILTPICDSKQFSTIDTNTLRSLLPSDTTVTYYGFLMVLSRCEHINSVLGVLPKKSEMSAHLAKSSQEYTLQDPQHHEQTQTTKSPAPNPTSKTTCPPHDQTTKFQQKIAAILDNKKIDDVKIPINPNKKPSLLIPTESALKRISNTHSKSEPKIQTGLKTSSADNKHRKSISDKSDRKTSDGKPNPSSTKGSYSARELRSRSGSRGQGYHGSKVKDSSSGSSASDSDTDTSSTT